MPNTITTSSSWPKPYSAADAARGLDQWRELAAEGADNDWMHDAALMPALEAVFGNSPYLSRLLLLAPELLRDMGLHGADSTYNALIGELAGITTDDPAELMRLLRIAKGEIALLVALADMSEAWTLEQVTRALSVFAERSLQLSVDVLLRGGHKRGEIILPHADAPSRDSGFIVLGLGKLGAYELNYSSDIDLILFFEPGRLSYKGRQTEQHFMNKLAHDLVNIMQERTRDGYVFRTDLRLRPDPASTPPVVTTGAAHYYYESVGQNWERAAMIKARPLAGDIETGEKFLKELAPFMWRRSLDFAAINDIHSIKRQMDSTRRPEISMKGHNIKLGQGGIREIEFYTQIHQLIWGGREPGLRTRATLATLAHLVEMSLVDSAAEARLADAYGFLRKLEHRLQMIADEQTHDLPTTDDGIAHIACFMGYKNVNDFEMDLIRHLGNVHSIYASSFKSAEQLGDGGNLVFTGVTHDPETLKTLAEMGYAHPEVISESVMGWHHGSRRATRTKRARELLTELMPALLKRLAETANPDVAFLKFNEFLSNLPAGVQLFSLFSVNPHLLALIADIMGSAPTLADTLSRQPELLDAVLYEDFYGPLPSPPQLAQQMHEALKDTRDFEDSMERLHRCRNEKQFQAGVQLLKNMIASQQAGIFLSDLADAVIAKALEVVTAEFTHAYGAIEDGRFAIIALGKLGSREMTFSSDIDLVFVYDAPEEASSHGKKPLGTSVYYNRLAQRFVGALSAMGRDGRLYEVDTRLRPSGTQGMLAVSSRALARYFDEQAWTFEFMAFTRARMIHGDGTLKDVLDEFIIAQIMKSRDRNKLKTDVCDMRERIAKEHGTDNPWDIKQVRGGLMDIDFIAQYLLLKYAPDTPGTRSGSASHIFGWLKRSNRLDAKTADMLMEADRFLGQLFNMLRLCCDRMFDEVSAPPGLKKLLTDSVKEKDFAALKARLIEVERAVAEQYTSILGEAKNSL